ncbi:MAG: 6-carboxytetrahydropterin synthase QueD [Candidatus Aureabacteria bacterium]|nr:6-carboxytetrahydropterin synthase QueD [Candidatus Auribacterota bacterium]
MHELSVRTSFSSAHSLDGYEGPCSNMHGHNWDVEVFIRCRSLDEMGMVRDFRELKDIIKEVISGFDHRNLNELPCFSDRNPTAENIACLLFSMLSGKINDKRVKVSKVTVKESSKTGVSYWED